MSGSSKTLDIGVRCTGDGHVVRGDTGVGLVLLRICTVLIPTWNVALPLKRIDCIIILAIFGKYSFF